MEIIQIVAQLPPAINGLGDQAYLLAKELRRAHGIGTKFVVCDPRPNSELGLDGFEIVVTERTGQALLETLNQFSPSIGPALLHYVGYGYAQRGIPFWLVDGLKKWRAGGDGRRLITMFYEVYASGPPWRSSFWTSPFQRTIAAALARTSDARRTNMQRYARMLERISGKVDISVMPVFSNVGETVSRKPIEQRKRRIVVFGGATWRAQVYKKHRSELLAACRAFDFDELADIGPATGLELKLPIPLKEYGIMSAAEISAILNDARMGILCYPPPFLAKSTIFATYAAYGVVPMLLGSASALSEDDLREGIQYVTAESLNSCDLDDISRAANSWYNQHDLASTARAYAQVIANLTT